ncbi:MAG: ComF family protein [Clostridia bacterium]|nr:ComF family protein [Clostridia bacterium]
MIDFEKIAHLLFPSPCIYCGGASGGKEYGFCPSCRDAVPFGLKKSGDTWYLFDYDKKIAGMLKKAKYAGRPYAIKMLAGLAGSLLKNKGVRPDIVAYVPMHRSDLGKRGYNQSRIAAVEIARSLDCRCYPGALRKIEKNLRQAGLSKANRGKNVRGVYKADKAVVSGKRVLLIDDIMTTGSTINECCRELLSAGAVSVESAVIAHTPYSRRK